MAGASSWARRVSGGIVSDADWVAGRCGGLGTVTV